jgi:hypothetical protein
MPNKHLIMTVSIVVVFALVQVAEAGRYGGGRGHSGGYKASVGKHPAGGGYHQQGQPRHPKKSAYHKHADHKHPSRPRRTHVAGWPLESHFPNHPELGACIGSDCRRKGSKYRGGYRDDIASQLPYYGYSRFRRGVGTVYRDDSPPIVVVAPQPAPAQARREPQVKTVRNWVPPEKSSVWVPERKSCGIKKKWMGDHWKFSTDTQNCRTVPGRMEMVVTRPGYFKEEVVPLSD